jgi:ABC-2 type transport system permease protein
VNGGLLSLMKAEWRKVTSTKLLWILILASIAFNALNIVILVLVAPDSMPGLTDLSPLMDEGYISTVLATAGGASVFVLILGIIGMTGEYRHMTITSTLLATPRRGRMVLAKGVTYALLGAAFAIINVIAVLAITLLTLTGKEHAAITPGMIGTITFGVTLGLAIYAVLGISVGALLKNQVAAIVIAIIWVLLVEPLVGLFIEGSSKWLPGGALNAAMDVTTAADLTTADVLPVWGGAALLLAYAVVFGTIASLTTVRRDIT